MLVAATGAVWYGQSRQPKPSAARLNPAADCFASAAPEVTGQSCDKRWAALAGVDLKGARLDGVRLDAANLNVAAAAAVCLFKRVRQLGASASTARKSVPSPTGSCCDQARDGA